MIIRSRCNYKNAISKYWEIIKLVQVFFFNRNINEQNIKIKSAYEILMAISKISHENTCTSIFRPSTTVPLTLSRARSASAAFANVTKPNPCIMHTQFHAALMNML